MPILSNFPSGVPSSITKELANHVGSKKNPHAVTAEQIGALPLTGGTLTGDLTGKHIVGTWLQTTQAGHQTTKATKIAVLDASGLVYYRTPAELMSDMGISNGDEVAYG